MFSDSISHSRLLLLLLEENLFLNYKHLMRHDYLDTTIYKYTVAYVQGRWDLTSSPGSQKKCLQVNMAAMHCRPLQHFCRQMKAYIPELSPLPMIHGFDVTDGSWVDDDEGCWAAASADVLVSNKFAITTPTTISATSL